MDHEVVVIGAGFSGIGAAIKLDEAGFRDFVVLEAGDGVGGAWHWNTYPGIAVDIPSFSYQFSFEKLSDWSRVYAPGMELKAYAEHCVDKYGVRDRIQLNTKVVGARFDEDAHAWRIQTANGEQITARYVVGATGVFSQPKPPEIEGLDSFAGTTMHTARWDHSVELRGKRVGVIGTGASAIQLIPAIAPEVEQLTVFQRTPIWCLPKLDAPMSPRVRRALRSVPGAELATRWASQAFVEVTFVLAAHFAGTFSGIATRGEATARKMLREVKDPVVREKLTPKYSLGCKRPSFSNEYIPAFNRENVLLETTSIEAITETGVRMSDGVEHPLDVLVLATGFKVFDSGNLPAFEMLGAGGVDLEEWWDANRLQAYEGVSVPGFPELILDPGSLRVQRPVLLRSDRDPDAPHRALPEAGAQRRRHARGGHARGQPSLLRVDARAPPQPGLLPGRLLEREQLLLRQARRRAVPGQPLARGGVAQRPLQPRRLRVRTMTDPDLPGSGWVELLRVLAGSILAGAR